MCAAEDGSRAIAVNVTVTDWEIATGVMLNAGAPNFVAVKSGGAEGWGSGLSLSGSMSGEIELALMAGIDNLRDVTFTVFAAFSKTPCAAAAEHPKPCGFVFNRLDVAIGFEIARDDPSVQYSVVGHLDFTYPCEYGNTANGKAVLELGINEFKMDNFTISVTYYCGVDKAMAELPLLATQGASVLPVQLTESIALSGFSFEMKVYRATEAGRRTNFQGVVKGVIDTNFAAAAHALSTSAAALGAESNLVVSTEVMFDTRGEGSWGVTARITYVNECLTATLSFMATSNCGVNGETRAVTGDTFIECQDIKGYAQIAGTQFCSPEGKHEAIGYFVTITIPSLSIQITDEIEVIVQGVTGHLRGRVQEEASGGASSQLGRRYVSR
mmetsp:Transcript_19156/g.47836  ORF Transcript_19156/g.47836 Transcript_19156/m.47836 type:complete len:384 (-) Transcript_19156:1937-3088(-)